MYKIKPLKSARDGIYKTPAQRAYILPPPGTTIFCGRTGSGKTTIVCRLLKDENKLKEYFDDIYIFCLSPCYDVIEHVPQITEDHMYTDDDPEQLAKIYEKNKAIVKQHGFDKAKHILFILDDIVQSNKFMNSKVLRDIFFGGTHAKCSLWLLTQHYKSIPKRLRMNSHAMICCHGLNKQEIESLCEEYVPPSLTKNEFKDVVDYALKDPYSFLFINSTNPNKKEMYRKNFDEILIIN